MAYFSRMIATRHHNLPTYEKELVVLVKLIKHWWSYPWGHNFIIHTYHYSLKFFLEKGVLSLSQQHWSSKLLGYSFSIEYKVGRLNTVANALSRRDVDNSILMAIYMPHLSILMKFAMSSNILLPCNISSHKFLVAQLLQLGIISKAYSSTRLEFFFCQKILLQFKQPWQHSIIKVMKGIKKLYFIFPYVTNSYQFTEFSRFCFGQAWGLASAILLEHVVYAKGTKSKHCNLQFFFSPFLFRLKYGLTSPWILLKDYLLPGGKNVILVVMDCFSKFAHFLPLLHPYTIVSVVRLFFDHIFKLHGLPETLVINSRCYFH